MNMACRLHDDVELEVGRRVDPSCSGDGAAGHDEHRVPHRLVAHVGLGVERDPHVERAASLVLGRAAEGRGERFARYRCRCRSRERPPADAHRGRLAARMRGQRERDVVALRGLDCCSAPNIDP